MAQFKRGDTVKLKTSPLKMIVQGETKESVMVTWTAADGIHKKIYKIDDVILTTPEKRVPKAKKKPVVKKVEETPAPVTPEA